LKKLSKTVKQIKLTDEAVYYLSQLEIDERLDSVDGIEFCFKNLFKHSSKEFIIDSILSRVDRLLEGIVWYYECKFRLLKRNNSIRDLLFKEQVKLNGKLQMKQMRLDILFNSYSDQLLCLRKKVKELESERNKWMNKAISCIEINKATINTFDEYKNMLKDEHAWKLSELLVKNDHLEYQLNDLNQRYDQVAKRNIQLLSIKKGAKEHLRFRLVAEGLEYFVVCCEKISKQIYKFLKMIHTNIHNFYYTKINPKSNKNSVRVFCPIKKQKINILYCINDDGCKNKCEKYSDIKKSFHRWSGIKLMIGNDRK